MRRWSPGLLGSVVFRTAEAVMYLVIAASLLSMLALGHRLMTAWWRLGPYRAIADSLLDIRQQVTLVGVFAFALEALLY